MELVDDEFIRATNKLGISKRKWPVKDSLFFKFQGHSKESLKDTARVVKEVVEQARFGGTGFQVAHDEQEASDLWADRKNAYYSSLALVEGSKGWPTDVWYVLSLPVMNRV